MALLDEFWSWVRGTRARPPPGPSRPIATLFLYAAAFLHLPLVYLLVRDVALAPAFAITVGALAMALAWSGGVALEGRRPGTTRGIALAAIAEGAFAFLPGLAESLGQGRWFFVGVAALAACALGALLRR